MQPFSLTIVIITSIITTGWVATSMLRYILSKKVIPARTQEEIDALVDRTWALSIAQDEAEETNENSNSNTK